MFSNKEISSGYATYIYYTYIIESPKKRRRFVELSRLINDKISDHNNQVPNTITSKDIDTTRTLFRNQPEIFPNRKQNTPRTKFSYTIRVKESTKTAQATRCTPKHM